MFGRKRSKKPASLLDAIEEEVAQPRIGTPTGAIPIETNVRKKRIEALQEQVVGAARKPRTLVLLVLLLAAVLALAVVKWTEGTGRVIPRQQAAAPGIPLPDRALPPDRAALAQLPYAADAGEDGGRPPADAGVPDAGEPRAEAQPPPSAREPSRRSKRRAAQAPLAEEPSPGAP